MSLADASNTMVRTKIDVSYHMIEHLCLSRSELEASIPASTVNSTLALKDVNVKQLKSSLDLLNSNIKKRTVVIERLKKQGVEDDIGNQTIYIRTDTDAGRS